MITFHLIFSGFGYGTDYDSDYELDEKEQYVLKAPPSRNIMSRFAYTSASNKVFLKVNFSRLTS